jgi:hypothetical protein
MSSSRICTLYVNKAFGANRMIATASLIDIRRIVLKGYESDGWTQMVHVSKPLRRDTRGLQRHLDFVVSLGDQREKGKTTIHTKKQIGQSTAPRYT